MSLVRSGWTRVRRLEDRGFADGGEGYVPTSFLKMLWGGTTTQGLGDSVDRGPGILGSWGPGNRTLLQRDAYSAVHGALRLRNTRIAESNPPRDWISVSLDIRFMWFALQLFVSIARPMVYFASMSLSGQKFEARVASKKCDDGWFH